MPHVEEFRHRHRWPPLGENGWPPLGENRWPPMGENPWPSIARKMASGRGRHSGPGGGCRAESISAGAGLTAWERKGTIWRRKLIVCLPDSDCQVAILPQNGEIKLRHRTDVLFGQGKGY